MPKTDLNALRAMGHFITRKYAIEPDQLGSTGHYSPLSTSVMSPKLAGRAATYSLQSEFEFDCGTANKK